MWDDEEGEMCWEEDEALRLEHMEEEVYSCNTRKDKDKRICQHTFGFFLDVQAQLHCNCAKLKSC